MMIKKSMDEESALKKIATLCAKSEQCTGDVNMKLQRWGIDADARTRIINKLKANNYIDDTRFAEAFIHDKMAFDQWGPHKIKQALRMKQVPEQAWRPIIEGITDVQWHDQLLPVITGKWPTIKAESEYERVQKVMKYAFGRGYSLETIRQCLKTMAQKLRKEIDTDAEWEQDYDME